MDKIAIIATVLSIVSIVFAIVSLIDLNRISFDNPFVIEFKDGNRLNMRNGLNEFREAEKIIDAFSERIK